MPHVHSTICPIMLAECWESGFIAAQVQSQLTKKNRTPRQKWVSVFVFPRNELTDKCWWRVQTLWITSIGMYKHALLFVWDFVYLNYQGSRGRYFDCTCWVDLENLWILNFPYCNQHHFFRFTCPTCCCNCSFCLVQYQILSNIFHDYFMKMCNWNCPNTSSFALLFSVVAPVSISEPWMSF